MNSGWCGTTSVTGWEVGADKNGSDRAAVHVLL